MKITIEISQYEKWIIDTEQPEMKTMKDEIENHANAIIEPLNSILKEAIKNGTSTHTLKISEDIDCIMNKLLKCNIAFDDIAEKNNERLKTTKEHLNTLIDTCHRFIASINAHLYQMPVYECACGFVCRSVFEYVEHCDTCAQCESPD